MAREPFRPIPALPDVDEPTAGDNVIPLPVRARRAPSSTRPSRAQEMWLRRGLDQPGGKLPLFDHQGRSISQRTIRSCMNNGWAEPWFNNPIKPGWLVCRLTQAGRDILHS